VGRKKNARPIREVSQLHFSVDDNLMLVGDQFPFLHFARDVRWLAITILFPMSGDFLLFIGLTSSDV
jgi:hypothetical protein